MLHWWIVCTTRLCCSYLMDLGSLFSIQNSIRPSFYHNFLTYLWDGFGLFGQFWVGHFRFTIRLEFKSRYELLLNAESRKDDWELDLRKQCIFGCGDSYHIQTELNEWESYSNSLKFIYYVTRQDLGPGNHGEPKQSVVKSD